MNTANKPAHTETLWKMTEKSMPTSPTCNVLYLLDGGNLLNKLQWKKGETVQQICQHYVNYVNGNYEEKAEVMFDGYPDELTNKDTNHLKRIKEKKGISFKFALNSKISV